MDTPASRRSLAFDPNISNPDLADTIKNLSAIALHESSSVRHLWLGGDEGAVIEGSHSTRRKEPSKKKNDEENRTRLATVEGPQEGQRNRHFFARIPINKDGDLIRVDGMRSVARLDGDASGDQITHLIRADQHLGPFSAIPSKDNGIDIEGLAIVGSRAFLGLRGPVLRGWAVIIECEWKDSGAGIISLEGHPDATALKKHFLKLDGLGVRDLAIDGEDLYILAGPTMSLDGPVFLYRWREALRNKSEAMIWKPEKICEIPFGQGKDHAEGLALIRNGAGKLEAVICYDSPYQARLPDDRPEQVMVDIFSLP